MERSASGTENPAAMRNKLATKEMPFRVYMGYDSHEDITFEVAKYSLKKRASVPVEVIPLKRHELQSRGIYTRTQDPKQSTEFTYCRFFVPYLNNYKGWAMFVDDDFLWLGDIAELLDQVDDSKAIICVQHDYKPTVTQKLAGRAQSPYPRKNWSSMVLWNCGHPANAGVNLSMINSEGGPFLHRFSWIKDDNLIGKVDYTWNFLVGWYEKYEGDKKPCAIHYTEGGPWFPDYRETDYAREWFDELMEYEKTLPKQRLLCPYELFSTKGKKPLPGYPNSNETWTWPDD
jgi:lipopolysaccharide biosynthesis glycosyltransferase